MGLKDFTDEELALLTDEERAAMEEAEGFDENVVEGKVARVDDDGQPENEEPAAGSDDGEGDDDQVEEDDQDEGDPEGDGAGDDEGADPAGDDGQDETENADDASEDEQKATEDDAPARSPAAEALPEDWEDRMKAIADQKKSLIEQFDEGDLTTAEYQTKLDDLNRQERELERIKDRVEYDRRQRYDRWVNVDVARFLDAHPLYRQKPKLLEILDREVRKLQAKAAIDTDPEILVQAHESIKSEFPELFSAPKKQPKKAADPAPKKSAPNLARVPAANIDNPGEGEFAYLESLAERNPTAYEEALLKLAQTDPAKYDRYLASQ